MIAALLLALTAVPAPDAPPARVRSVVLLAGERCPAPSSPDEIVVCAREDEPYRIPKPLRRAPDARVESSWGVRALTVDAIGRVAGGLPNTCSPIGSGGATGCTLAALGEWSAERRARDEAERDVP